MTSETNKKKVKKTVIDTHNALSKGYEAFRFTEGYKYVTKFDTSKSCVVSVIDKTIKGSNNWVIRFDRPHVDHHNFNHININSAISGVKDPHIKLPPGGLQFAEGTARFFNGLNKVVLPLAIILDAIQTGVAVYNDFKNKTTRNTVETLAGITSGWLGGWGGATGGAALGTAIFPGVGTIMGAIVGGIAGGIGGSLGVSAIANEIGDSVEYNIKTIVCVNCKKEFKWRKYEEKEPECPYCKKKSKNL